MGFERHAIMDPWYFCHVRMLSSANAAIFFTGVPWILFILGPITAEQISTVDDDKPLGWAVLLFRGLSSIRGSAVEIIP